MKYFTVILFFIANLAYGQVSLGKDGKFYEGVFNPLFLPNGPIDIPLNSFYNLYDENGIRFSVKLVIGDDSYFQAANMACDPHDDLSSTKEIELSKRNVTHYRLVFLIENTNSTKEVEFTNAQAFYAQMEMAKEPAVHSICSMTNAGSYLSASTGRITMGSNSSLEICDVEFGEWFFEKPNLTGYTVSNYVLRSENANLTKSTVRKNSSCIIPATYLQKQETEEIVINDEDDSFWNSVDEVIEKNEEENPSSEPIVNEGNYTIHFEKFFGDLSSAKQVERSFDVPIKEAIFFYTHDSGEKEVAVVNIIGEGGTQKKPHYVISLIFHQSKLKIGEMNRIKLIDSWNTVGLDTKESAIVKFNNLHNWGAQWSNWGGHIVGESEGEISVTLLDEKTLSGSVTFKTYADGSSMHPDKYSSGVVKKFVATKAE